MEMETGRGGAKIPDKLFYKVGEVCQITDTQPYVLRFWESEFPQLAPEKNRTGQRVYRKADIDLIFRIKKLLYDEEYTIAGARKRIAEQDGTAIAAPARGRRPKGAEPSEPADARAEDDRPPAASLFGESRPEAPPPASTAGEDPYRSLYEEALQTVEMLKADLAAASASRDALREKHRRVVTALEAVIER
jgi:DNA-binding transcriptional MerR regulator